MEAHDFDAAIGGGYSDERREIFKTTASKLKVMARAPPFHKSELVEGLVDWDCYKEQAE